ncbi:MAG TPA: ABC transporter permease [Bacteroidales bacterium]|nr:ABC transporter permease [Bacteroidales bacterium]
MLILKRIGYVILLVWGVLTFLFILFNMLPSDPVRLIMGQRSDVATEEAIRKKLGLDKPLYIQYFKYLNDISPLGLFSDNEKNAFFYEDNYLSKTLSIVKFKNVKFGIKPIVLHESYITGQPVWLLIKEAFPLTLILAVVTMIIALFLSIILGSISAIKVNTWIDRLIIIFSSIGMSLPSFFAALLIAWIFGYLLHDFTGLSMHGNLVEVDELSYSTYIDWKNLILPAFTLSIRPLAVFVPLIRNSMLDVLNTDYIKTAMAKGLSNNRIIFHHVFPAAMNPLITSASGWFASLLAGSVFVEYVFNWRGMGSLIVESLQNYDLPVLKAGIFIIALLFIFVTLLVDLIYLLIDPRVRDKGLG